MDFRTGGRADGRTGGLADWLTGGLADGRTGGRADWRTGRRRSPAPCDTQQIDLLTKKLGSCPPPRRARANEISNPINRARVGAGHARSGRQPQFLPCRKSGGYLKSSMIDGSKIRPSARPPVRKSQRPTIHGLSCSHSRWGYNHGWLAWRRCWRWFRLLVAAAQRTDRN